MSLRYNTDQFLKRFEQPFETHNRIEVSVAALRHNVQLFRGLSKKLVIPVLKGNAYGHGVELVARALRSEELPYIAVDGYFEALAIRRVSKQPVLVMGAIKAANFARLSYDNFAFVVQDAETVRALVAAGKRVKVHLEVNTGMNRYGAGRDELVAMVDLILQSKNLQLEGLMSHLADSDGDDPQTVRRAVGRFDEAVEIVRQRGAEPSILHVAQTAGSVVAQSKYANAMRLGLGLYGVNPFPAGHSRHETLKDLRPALKLLSTITKVTELAKGDQVSYNYTFTAPKAMTIGVLPLGYYEGVNRGLSNIGRVTIDGRPLSIVGRVCMNHTMIDLTGTDAKVGDEVVVYSDNSQAVNSIDNIAAAHGLFNYSLLTSLSKDVRRHLL